MQEKGPFFKNLFTFWGALFQPTQQQLLNKKKLLMKYAIVNVGPRNESRDGHKISCKILYKWPSDSVWFTHPSKLLLFYLLTYMIRRGQKAFFVNIFAICHYVNIITQHLHPYFLRSNKKGTCYLVVWKWMFVFLR